MKINTERIKYEMSRKKWAVPDLAKAIGLTERAVFFIIEKKSTTMTTLTKIAKAFKVDGRELLE